MAQEEDEKDEIPEHDAITRRKQFRRKKERKADAKAKAEKKKEEKKLKEAEKEAKKADRLRKKLEKENAKKQELPKKKGPKSKKLETLKAMTKIHRKNSKEKMEQDAQEDEEIAKSGETEVKENGPEEKTVEDEACSKKRGQTVDAPVDPARQPKKAKKEVAKDKRRKRPVQEASPKAKSKAKAKAKAKAAAKPAGKAKAKSGPKPRSGRPTLLDGKICIDQDVKDLVKATVKECKQSSCFHPNFKMEELNKLQTQLSVYWTRKTVGVKMNSKLLKGPQKNKFTQVAYFSSPTPCTYTNIILALKYVIWWHVERFKGGKINKEIQAI